MSWSLYRWSWQLESPLYIGMPPAGSINRCRLYVPARAMWGAVTAELARSTANGFPDYQGIGRKLKESVRFTYLYPAERDGSAWRAWLPRYEPGAGLIWRREDRGNDLDDIPDRMMRMRLLDTRAATAIDASSGTAAEGSLRETECINTRWRDQDGRAGGPVALVGYVFMHYDLDEELCTSLKQLKAIMIGGDTRYGMGRLKLMEPATPANRIFGMDRVGDSPIVKTPIVLAHGAVQGCMRGAREVLSGWDVGHQTALNPDKTPFWIPGSSVTEEDGAKPFNINELGIWCLEDEGVAQTPAKGGTVS